MATSVRIVKVKTNPDRTITVSYELTADSWKETRERVFSTNLSRQEIIAKLLAEVKENTEALRAAGELASDVGKTWTLRADGTWREAL